MKALISSSQSRSWAAEKSETPKAAPELTSCGFIAERKDGALRVQGSVIDETCDELAHVPAEVTFRGDELVFRLGEREIAVTAECFKRHDACFFYPKDDFALVTPKGKSIIVGFTGMFEGGMIRLDDVTWHLPGLDTSAPDRIVKCDFATKLVKNPGPATREQSHWSICRRLEHAFTNATATGPALTVRYEGTIYVIVDDEATLGNVKVRFRRSATGLHDFTWQ